MSEEEKLPRLREDLEYLWTVYQGKEALVVKDPVGLVKKPLVIYGETLNFLRLLQRSTSIDELQLNWIRMNQGVFSSQTEIRQMVDDLDRLFLLDTPHYRREKQAIVQSFARLSVRPPALAGQAYPAEKESLLQFLKGILDKGKKTEITGRKVSLKGLIVPHIDLEVGARVYAAGYRLLPARKPPLILLLGTGHHLSSGLVSLTSKDFETPLGRVRTAKDIIEELKKDASRVISPDDFAHRSEHSLEFQLLFLQYLYGDSFEIVPILIGSFHEYLLGGKDFKDIPGLLAWVTKIKQIIHRKQSQWLIIASVDLAHVGLKFGHSLPGEALVSQARANDEKLMTALARGDAQKFWQINQEVKDKYNICGFSALMILMLIWPGLRGELLDYDFWIDSASRSAVSFAAFGLYGDLKIS